MPEVHFRVRWPGGAEETCYSPSTVILEHLVAGESYAVPEFCSSYSRCARAGLERCAHATVTHAALPLDQLRQIEERVRAMPDVEQRELVTVLALSRQEARDARHTPDPKPEQEVEVPRISHVVLHERSASTFPWSSSAEDMQGSSMSYLLAKAGIARTSCSKPNV